MGAAALPRARSANNHRYAAAMPPKNELRPILKIAPIARSTEEIPARITPPVQALLTPNPQTRRTPQPAFRPWQTLHYRQRQATVMVQPLPFFFDNPNNVNRFSPVIAPLRSKLRRRSHHHR
jgi:hypothetical protein